MNDHNIFNPDFFEAVPCNLCGADDADTLFAADSTRIPQTKKEFIDIYSSASDSIFYEQVVRCKKCSLIYLSPRPRRELIIGGYSQAEDKAYVSQEKSREKTFSRCLKTIQRYVKTGKLLDIGAASGTFVKVASAAGYQACGIEPARWMCEFAKKNYNVSLLPVELEEAQFKDNSFDIITMWDVLEHVPNPLHTLKEIKRILRPDGLLVINYPRIDDPLARVFGRRWWFLLSVHLFYFTPKTLTAYMQKVRFEKVLHAMHIQSLEYGYLVKRLTTYSSALAKAAESLCAIPNFREFPIPYFASQYLLIARNKK